MGTKILIALDETINLEFFDLMFTKLGFDVVRAADGNEALEKTVREKPDLVLLDAILPELTGWKVVRLLKTDEEYQDCRQIPVILFSETTDVRDKIEAFEMGVEDFITKPFNFSEVLARMRSVLRHQELVKQLIQSERRVSLVDSLNKSLVYFTEHLRGPVGELVKEVDQVGCSDADEMAHFIELVRNEVSQVQAALKGLEDEIAELKDLETKAPLPELDLKTLDSKFRKHFELLRDDEAIMEEGR